MAGNSFNLAEGVVVFKGDFNQFEQDIQKAEKQVAGLTKALNDGSMRMAATAANAINKEMAKASLATKRMMDEIRLGKMGVLMRDAAAGLQRFQQNARMVGMAGMAAGGAAIGAASVASPLAGDTLQGSMKLLTATVGRDFIPLVMKLSFTLQGAARWWKELDPAIKSTTAEVVKMVAMAGAASLAFLGLAKVLSFVKAHPIMTAMGLGAGIGTLVNERNNAAGAKQFAGGQADINGIAWKDVLNDGRMAELRSMGAGAGAAAEKDWRQKKAEYEAAATESNNYQKGWLGGGGWKAGVQRNNDWDGSTQKELIEKATRAQAEWTKSEMRWKGIAGDAPKDATVGDSRGKGAEAAAKGNRNLLGSFGPSSYSSLGDFYRQMNLATTGGSELESELQKIQEQTRDEIIKMRQELEKLNKPQ